MAEFDLLLRAYSSHVHTPWRENLSGAEKVWFLVYNPASERRFRKRMPELALATQESQHGWVPVDLTSKFPEWLTTWRHREGCFRRPEGLPEQLFHKTLCDGLIIELLKARDGDVVALMGAGSLYGVLRLSSVVKAIEGEIKGRLLVCFPGVREANTYKLFDTADGWNYLGIPIVVNREINL